MKYLLFIVLATISACFPRDVVGQTYINDMPLNSPPDALPSINATTWINRAPFNITNVSGTLPFESRNTVSFLNQSIMGGDPGYRFFYNTGTQRLPMNSWVNHGSISTDHNTFFGSIFLFDSRASMVIVNSDVIESTGPISSGAHGLVHLEGNSITLSRNSLRAGAAPLNQQFFGGGFLLSTNYVNDFGITDLHWGAGRNNALTNGVAMRLDNQFQNFQDPYFVLPAPDSPRHAVVQAGFTFTNFIQLPFVNFAAGYTATAYTNQVGPTNFVVQVVFYPTNNPDPDFSTDVRFSPFFGGDQGGQVTVAFRAADYDIVTQTTNFNSIYLVDALGTQTNVALARAISGTTRRPNTYEITRTPPFFFGTGFGVPGNAPFTPSLLYRPTMQFNSVSNLYAAYRAFVSSLNGSGGPGTNADATNVPGRVTILGNRVSMDETRIRAESSFVLKTDNLVSNRLAKVDAPLLDIDVASLQPQLLISNLAPRAVHRMSGDIACWSGTWRNYEEATNNPGTTNEIFFHVLFIDHNIQTLVPVIAQRFSVSANSLNIADQISIRDKVLIDTPKLNISGGLTLPTGADWASTNFLRVVEFTNSGLINITRAGRYGSDRGSAYNNFINYGTNIASAQFIRTKNFLNTGCILANGGLLQVSTPKAMLLGAPTILATNVIPLYDFFTGIITNYFTNVVANSIGAKLAASSDVIINANELFSSNSIVEAGSNGFGSIILNITNSFNDAGPSALNVWTASSGFQSLLRPPNSTLLGTHLRSNARQFSQQNVQIWCALDRGASVSGFNNNVAVGKVTLDGVGGTLFRFAPAQGLPNTGMYIDYLELLNNATNYNTALQIDPGLIVYFANANLTPSKLDGIHGGRLRWVKNFTGPLSSTNITYPSGRTYTFNVALALSKDLDCDLDGTVNAFDPTPFFTEESAAVSAELVSKTPAKMLVSWPTRPGAVNRLEYKIGAETNQWQTLTNFTTPGTLRTVSVTNSIPGTKEVRLYRAYVSIPQTCE